VNWEVANIATLHDQSEKAFTVLVVGVEGCKTISSHSTTTSPSIPRSARTGRSQRWLCSTPRKPTSTDEIKLHYEFSGVLDWGLFYAANSFFDPVSKQRVLFGWILEEDLSDGLREQQGWSGCISLPRVLSMQTISGVDTACKGVLNTVPGFTYREDGKGRLEVTTICCRPAPQLKGLRYGDAVAMDSLARFESLEDVRGNTDATLDVPGLPSVELDAVFTFDNEYVDHLGIDIYHTPGKFYLSPKQLSPLRPAFFH